MQRTALQLPFILHLNCATHIYFVGFGIWQLSNWISFYLHERAILNNDKMLLIIWDLVMNYDGVALCLPFLTSFPYFSWFFLHFMAFYNMPIIICSENSFSWPLPFAPSNLLVRPILGGWNEARCARQLATGPLKAIPPPSCVLSGNPAEGHWSPFPHCPNE